MRDKNGSELRPGDPVQMQAMLFGWSPTVNGWLSVHVDGTGDIDVSPTSVEALPRPGAGRETGQVATIASVRAALDATPPELRNGPVDEASDNPMGDEPAHERPAGT